MNDTYDAEMAALDGGEPFDNDETYGELQADPS